MRKRRGLDALVMQRARTRSLLEGLAAADWDAPCLPRWAVRDVVAHLVASDQGAVTGAVLRPLLNAGDRDAVERWNDSQVLRWRDRSGDELIAGLDRWGGRMMRVASWTPGLVAQLPISTPYGRHPLVFLLYLRVWDEWVHEQDVRWAVEGTPRDEVPSAPPLLLGEVLAQHALAVLPRRALPKVSRSVGIARLLVDPAPPAGATSARPVVWGVDFARRQYGPRVIAAADSEIRIGAGALALLLASRVDWRELSDPWLTIDGDKDLAAELLDAVPLGEREGPGEA